ncbi:MAG TPA: hypothetical protein VGO16_08980, partial [Pseudonocardiaceae bacterium]|nr:hypothetical protein [Pseudonocardiaceae bacterium]
MGGRRRGRGLRRAHALRAARHRGFYLVPSVTAFVRFAAGRGVAASGVVHRVRDAPAPATASRRCADRNRCWYALGDT